MISVVRLNIIYGTVFRAVNELDVQNEWENTLKRGIFFIKLEIKQKKVL